jgi:hypothetical protein
MQPHAVKNIGETPATYYVINWSTEKSKKIPPKPAPATAQ